MHILAKIKFCEIEFIHCCVVKKIIPQKIGDLHYFLIFAYL